MSVPYKVSLHQVSEELKPAQAWAKRNGISLHWIEESLELQVILTQKKTGENFFLKGIFTDYKEEPPVWVFTDSSWSYKIIGDPISKSNFPNNEPTQFGSSIFHTNGVICAPFNRLAYKQYRGPHADWGTTAQWLSAGRKYVTADTIGDMLSIIYRDFLSTKSRLK